MASQADDILIADVVDLTHDGRGVAELDGHRVFVTGALPAERVRLRPERRRRRPREAELIEIITPAAARVVPPCPYFGVCGGCALQHLEYTEQLAFKRRALGEALSRLGGVEPAEWLPTLTGPEWHYRRRARLGIKYVTAKDRVLVGFRERSSSYVTDMEQCPVLVEPMDRLPLALSALVQASPLRQRIPQAEIAIGDEGGAIVLRVLDSPGEADRAAFLELGERFGADVYLQTGGPDSVAPIADSVQPLFYRLAAHDVRIDFEPGDFIQINGRVNEAMVDAVVEAAAPEGSDRVLDLYCGLGNFSLPFARRVAAVQGVEGVAPLVARAARNAANNGIANARFVTANLDEAEWPFFREPWDLVVLDPARAGAESAVAAMKRMRPRRVVYVSCHPGTLARDAGVLVREHGYRLTSARVLDMFPHTHHVEAITVFDRDA